MGWCVSVFVVLCARKFKGRAEKRERYGDNSGCCKTGIGDAESERTTKETMFAEKSSGQVSLSVRNFPFGKVHKLYLSQPVAEQCVNGALGVLCHLGLTIFNDNPCWNFVSFVV